MLSLIAFIHRQILTVQESFSHFLSPPPTPNTPYPILFIKFWFTHAISNQTFPSFSSFYCHQIVDCRRWSSLPVLVSTNNSNSTLIIAWNLCSSVSSSCASGNTIRDPSSSVKVAAEPSERINEWTDEYAIKRATSYPGPWRDQAYCMQIVYRWFVRLPAFLPSWFLVPACLDPSHIYVLNTGMMESSVFILWSRRVATAAAVTVVALAIIVRCGDGLQVPLRTRSVPRRIYLHYRMLKEKLKLTMMMTVLAVAGLCERTSTGKYALKLNVQCFLHSEWQTFQRAWFGGRRGPVSNEWLFWVVDAKHPDCTPEWLFFRPTSFNKRHFI